MVFDVGGNAAEWVTAKDTAEVHGGCAVLAPDARATRAIPSAAYVGFRVLKR